MPDHDTVLTVRLTAHQSATEADLFAHLHHAAARAGLDGGCPVPGNLDGLDELLGCMTDGSRVDLVAPGMSRWPRQRKVIALAVCAANGVTVDARPAR